MRFLRLLALRFARPEIEAIEAEKDARREANALLDRERQARASLEVTNASLQRENEFLRQQFETAITAERRALHMVANVGMQSKFGITPYPGDPGLPENGEVKPSEQMESGIQQGIDMARGARKTFIEDYKKRAAAGEALPIPADKIEEYVNSL